MANHSVSIFMKIRTFSKILVTLALCIPSIAFSRPVFQYCGNPHCGFFFSYFLGVNDVSSFTLSPDILPQLKLDFETGYYGGLNVGYRFYNLRMEEEVSLRYNVVNNYDHLPGRHGTCDSQRVKGEVMALSLMSNLYWDFIMGNRIMPFIGIGAGGTFLANSTTEPNPGADFSKNIYGFAWQAMAGIGILLNHHAEVDIIYKFYQATLFDYMNGVSNCASIPPGPGTQVNFSPTYQANTLALEWRIPPY